MSGQYKLSWLCEALLVSRSGYYDWKARRRQPGPRQGENLQLRARIRDEFARSRQTYGSPRLARALGCPGRRNRIARLMRQERLFAPSAQNTGPGRPTAAMADPIAPNRVENLRPPARSNLGYRRHVLAQHGLVASMSRKGNRYDKAFIESFWCILKYEVVYHQCFATFAQPRTVIFNYIETSYNRHRLHSSLAYLSPVTFET